MVDNVLSTEATYEGQHVTRANDENDGVDFDSNCYVFYTKALRDKNCIDAVLVNATEGKEKCVRD